MSAALPPYCDLGLTLMPFAESPGHPWRTYEIGDMLIDDGEDEWIIVAVWVTNGGFVWALTIVPEHNPVEKEAEHLGADNVRHWQHVVGAGLSTVRTR